MSICYLRRDYNNERLFEKGYVMGVSALGTGSSILTQDLLDKLQAADEQAQVQPLDLEIANQKDMLAEYSVIDANMTNLYDAIGELKTPALFDERSTSVTGTSVEISADANSDVQDFTLDVKNLATKEITESASFGADTDKIATDAGSMKLKVGSEEFTINYTADMTLKELKNAINNEAGDTVTASIIKIGDGDYKLFFTSKNTGDLNNDNNADGTDDNMDISIEDTSGYLSDDGGTTAGGTNLTDSMSLVQTGQDATFVFNGGDEIKRSSNDIGDLVVGYDITLKSTGLSEVSVSQNRDAINERVESFVDKYNSTMSELSRATKNSTDASIRGIFAGESTMRSLQSSLRGMMDSVGGGVGNLYDYGFDIDKNGKLSIDTTIFNSKIDENPSNVEIFFSGGEYDNGDGTTTTVDGAFTEMSSRVEEYTKYNGMMDNFKTYLNDTVSSLEDRKTKAQDRLNAHYGTLKQQFTAFDAMIAKFNNSSAAFKQMIDAGKSNDN